MWTLACHLACVRLHSYFNEYATAIEWIMTHNYQLHHLIHYLDNFFLAALPQSFCCQCDLDTFLQVASKLGVPVAMEKVEGPLTAMSFLGLILDSVKQEIHLPPEKLTELTHELQPDAKPQSVSYSHSSANCPLLRERSKRAVSSCVASSHLHQLWHTCIIGSA